MRTFKMFNATMIVGSMIFVAVAVAQTQVPTPPPEQRPPTPGTTPPQGSGQVIEGQVKSVDPSGRAITLMDGTTLVPPPGQAVRPGVLAEGDTVVARYTEQNGDKVLTDLAVKQPAASPPTERRPPGGPSTPSPSTPPGGSPKY